MRGHLIVADPLCDCGCPKSAHDGDIGCSVHGFCTGFQWPRGLQPTPQYAMRRERADFGGKTPQVTTWQSFALLDMLGSYHKVYRSAPANRAPQLLLLRGRHDIFGKLTGAWFLPFQLATQVWALAHPAMVLLALANMAADPQFLPRVLKETPGGQLLGVAFIADGRVYDPSTSVIGIPREAQGRMVRNCYAIDIDQRHYTVNRALDGGDDLDVAYVMTMAEFRRQTARASPAIPADLMPAPDGLPGIPRVLLRLLRRLQESEGVRR